MKVNLAFALGVLHQDIFDQLTAIARLRNTFAHFGGPVELTDDDLRYAGSITSAVTDATAELLVRYGAFDHNLATSESKQFSECDAGLCLGSSFCFWCWPEWRESCANKSDCRWFPLKTVKAVPKAGLLRPDSQQQ